MKNEVQHQPHFFHSQSKSLKNGADWVIKVEATKKELSMC